MVQKDKKLANLLTQQLTIREEGNKTCGKQKKMGEKYIQVTKSWSKNEYGGPHHGGGIKAWTVITIILAHEWVAS